MDNWECLVRRSYHVDIRHRLRVHAQQCFDYLVDTSYSQNRHEQKNEPLI
jgi:hypothetical protein